MKKSYRIKREQDFQRIIRQKNSFANRHVIVYRASNPTQPHFRVGLSVGKKVGNAVMRNQVKRYLRQSLWEIREAIPADSELIVIARPSIRNLSMAEVKQNIEHVLKLAKIL